MSLESPAYVISADSHSAALFRQTAQTLLSGTGVVGSGDLAVSENATPNMSVNVAPGMIWMPGTLGAATGFPANANAQTAYGLPSSFDSQGSYCAYQDGTVNLTIAAADATNPRIDIVVAAVQDAQYSGSTNQPVLQVVTGTPATTPVAPAAPASAVVLAQVAVAAGATSIDTADITDERGFARPGLNAATALPMASGSSPYFVQGGSNDGETDASSFLGITFPTPFPNGVVAVVATPAFYASPDEGGGPNTWLAMVYGTPTTSGFSVLATTDSGTGLASTVVRVNWIAVGW